MTTTEAQPPTPREDYIQINVPGLAYSVVFIPLWAEDFGPYFDQIARFREAYGARFAEAPQSGPPPVQTAPPWQPPQNTAAPAQRPQVAADGPVPGTTCPQCNGPAFFKAPFSSKAGKQISASLFCKTCKDGKFPHHIAWCADEVRTIADLVNEPQMYGSAAR